MSSLREFPMAPKRVPCAADQLHQALCAQLLMRSRPAGMLCCPTQTLSSEVASYLGVELGRVKVKRFADGEVYVQVGLMTGVSACVSCSGQV